MITCADGCKRTVAHEGEAEDAVWSFLAISGRWRCPDCARALRVAAGIQGEQAAETFVDPLPADSRGALPKATAHTITPTDPGLR
jgi:hypothetical protein